MYRLPPHAYELNTAELVWSPAPEIPVGAVAARCGFGSAGRFSQAFRVRFGIRAADMRRPARASRLA